MNFQVAKISIYSLLRKLQSCYFFRSKSVGLYWKIILQLLQLALKLLVTVSRAQTIAVSGLSKNPFLLWNLPCET